MNPREARVDDSEYRKTLKRYSLETLRDIERHLNRDLYPSRWEWLQEEVGKRLEGIAPLPSPDDPLGLAELTTFAGFFSRTLATTLDLALIFLPLMFWFRWGLRATAPVNVATFVVIPLVFPLYNLLCLHRWGQTLGKHAAGIRVVCVGSMRLPWRQVLLRHLPDILLALAMLLVLGTSSSALLLASASGPLKADQFHQLLPAWDRLDDLWDCWIWSECIALLFNDTRRGFHDYLAGTWVIHSSREAEFRANPPSPFDWRQSLHALSHRMLRLVKPRTSA